MPVMKVLIGSLLAFSVVEAMADEPKHDRPVSIEKRRAEGHCLIFAFQGNREAAQDCEIAIGTFIDPGTPVPRHHRDER